ncbi:MAG: hypothetical protein AAF351_13495 [Pseudomonadota bacterium]
MNSETISEPHQRWDALTTRLSISKHDAMYLRLANAYSEKHRHYHTLEHIEAMLNHFDHYRSLAKEPDSIELAIWFHDAIYKTRSKSNEEDSAEMARSFLTENGGDKTVAGKVAAMILATKHDAPIDDPDTALLVDIDLSILGAPEPVFWVFEDNVRKEYFWVPKFLYKKERRKILQSFLDRYSIYSTDVLKDQLESQAQTNVAAAIHKLR